MQRFIFSTSFVLLLSSALFSQHRISGVVVDNSKRPLMGATVQVVDIDKITVSDFDGKFEFQNLPNGQLILSVEYLGFEDKTVEVTVPNRNEIEIELAEQVFTLADIYVKGTWAGENSPFAYHTVRKEELEKLNLGQDLPFLLRNTPSLVVTSDAGAGVGYTGLRIRGSDASRINITVNGIPLNDSESQGVFWVNMPDFSSSTEAIQIQRGVGTSTNGSGAFGATVNLQTDNRSQEAFAELNNTFGSFNTHKHSLRLGSGILKNKISIESRLSLIQSDGYIDRASSDLKSAFLSAGYFGDHTVIKAIAFTGIEETYQSWYGTPEAVFGGSDLDLSDYADRNGLNERQRENLLTSGRTYNFYDYENEVDHYQQDHYQLHWSQYLNDEYSFNTALHYTHGAGYFEQFREQDDFETYGLSAITLGDTIIDSGDFIRRRWLDNDFLGYTANLKYEKKNLSLTLGNAYNKYYGDHFGELIWASFAPNLNIRDRYYENQGIKSDLNIFLKSEYTYKENWHLFLDMQFRKVDYSVSGIDSDRRALVTDVHYNFFNPKIGISRDIGDRDKIFLSAAVANREPNRSDLIDAEDGTKVQAENLLDMEFGYEARWNDLKFGLNLYHMSYKDQLVLTGALNEVGTPLRINVPESFRQGIELQFNWKLLEKLEWNYNSTFSMNKIKAFSETLYDYTDGFDIIENEFEKTDIAFSPRVIIGSGLNYQHSERLELNWNAKYVGSQFLDNTGNKNRSLDAYLVNDFGASWNPILSNYDGLSLNLSFQNFINHKYSSNGYTYSYIYGDTITENFYYPQAGINFLLGITLKF